MLHQNAAIHWLPSDLSSPKLIWPRWGTVMYMSPQCVRSELSHLAFSVFLSLSVLSVSKAEMSK